MAKFSKKMMGKEVGDAAVYAAPHTEVPATDKSDPQNKSAKQLGPRTGVQRVSAGDPGANDVKTTGIKIRGGGAATRGTMARGPMA
jgi:hypothetical protein